MKGKEYIELLVKNIHSVTVATIGNDGYPQTRIIDMMMWDKKGVYFLTAKGKAFYKQLMEQEFIAVSGTKNKKAVSLRGKIINIGTQKLNDIFERNSYMKEIYPEDTRNALEVFCLYEAQGEYFDISDPRNIVRAEIIIGELDKVQTGYFIGDNCTGCKLCNTFCPQRCIQFLENKALINQSHCLHCGRCYEICPQKAILKRG